MSKIHVLHVALEDDLEEGDAENLISAIGMLRGVAGVSSEAVTTEDWAARARVRSDLAEAIMRACDEITDPKNRSRERSE